MILLMFLKCWIKRLRIVSSKQICYNYDVFVFVLTFLFALNGIVDEVRLIVTDQRLGSRIETKYSILLVYLIKFKPKFLG